VSTKVGVIAEGPIDHVLLSALLERKAGYRPFEKGVTQRFRQAAKTPRRHS
jgi:hypothetical protein